MSRLLLEISSERSASDGTPADLPPILICTPDTQHSISAEAMPAPGTLILRFQDGGYALHQPSEANPAPLVLGEWCHANGWKVRMTQAASPEDNLSMEPGNPSWAAPELRVTTYDGDRVKRLRCMLPVDEGSQLVVGRGGSKADLIVEDEHVSRVHLRFFVDQGKQFVEDLGSRWGTKLNGLPLTDPQPLKHGDEIRLGKSTINYVCYWDILPKDDIPPDELTSSPDEPAGAMRSLHSDPVKPIAVDATPAQSLNAEKVASVIEGPKAGVPQPVPSKTVSAQPVSAQPVVSPVKDQPVATNEVKPVAKAPAVSSVPGPIPPPEVISKRDEGGVGGAVLFVLLVIAGIAYLAYRVFWH